MGDSSTKGSIGSADAFLDVVKSRRSIYAINSESTIPDSRIEEIVKFAVLHAPSAYNIQSARALVLFRDEHLKLWDIVKKHMTTALEGNPRKDMVLGRISKFRAAHGTALWFEDETALKGIAERNPRAAHMTTEWSNHSSGMHQFIVWAALEVEGLGASLQHFNFHEGILAEIHDKFDIPDAALWKLKAQIVFGKPVGGPGAEKTHESLDHRVLVRG